MWHDKIGSIKATTIQGESQKLPYLKASGKEAKALGRILLYISSKYIEMVSGFPIARVDKVEAAHGLQLNITMDELLRSHAGEYVLPTNISKQVRERRFEFNQTVTWLIQKLHPGVQPRCMVCSTWIQTLHPGVQAYHYTTKMHDLLHMGLASEYINSE